MKRPVYIIGAGSLNGADLLIPDNAFIIAADGGLKHLNHAGITPHLIIGDFDSLGSIPKGGNVIAHRPEKNDTDMMLAVKEALKLGAETIVIFGGLGGRFDHSIANLQTLLFIANRGAVGYLVGEGTVCTVVRNGGLAFRDTMGGTVSVFSLTESSAGVEIRGLKYPLTNYLLSFEFPLGISNEFIGAPASVSVKNGAIAIMWQGRNHCPNDYHKL